MRTLPLSLKLSWTAFASVLAPVYWRRYGPSNFLWFSDLAVFSIVAALWLEDRRIASVTAVAVIVPEIVWNADFAIALLRRGRTPIGLAAYMFDETLPRWLRAFSLFHLALLPLVALLIARLGYDERAFAMLVPIAIAVLGACFLFTDPAKNINWVFGHGSLPKDRFSRVGRLAATAGAFVFLAFLPAHLVLRRLR